MSSADTGTYAGDESVWYRIDLDDDQVAGLLDEYKLWRTSSWYYQVDWQRVVTTVENVLQRSCRDGLMVRGDLARLLAPVERTLKSVDREGLAALISEPVQIRRTELTNGGHRAAAMKRQHVRCVPGLCLRADVGCSIDPGQLYPIRWVDNGAR